LALELVNKVLFGLGRLRFLVVRPNGDPAAQQLVADAPAGSASRQGVNEPDDVNRELQ